MKTARQNTGQEKLFVFSLVYLTGSTPKHWLGNDLVLIILQHESKILDKDSAETI
jgi:hypothetical protein